MSMKSEKKARRQFKKCAKEITQDFIKHTKCWSLKDRLTLAIIIIFQRGKK